MEAFLQRARQQQKDQEENLSDARKKFPQTTHFFRYRVKAKKETDQIKEFFEHWLPFCSDFKDIFKNELQMRKKEALIEAKKKLMVKEEQKKKTVKSTTKVASGGLKDRIKKKLQGHN